jgi:phospholipid-translocating ATPase
VLELLNVNTELTSFSKIVFVSQILTFVVYILSIVLLKDVIDLASIDLQFVQRVAIIVALAWGPIQVMKVVRKRIDPTENEKIMKNIS